MDDWFKQKLKSSRSKSSSEVENLKQLAAQQLFLYFSHVPVLLCLKMLQVSAKWRAPTSCGLEMRCPDTARLDLSCAVNDQNFQNGSGTQRKLLNMSLSGLFQQIVFYISFYALKLSQAFFLGASVCAWVKVIWLFEKLSEYVFVSANNRWTWNQIASD